MLNAQNAAQYLYFSRLSEGRSRAGEINVLGNPVQHTLSIQTDKQIDRVLIHSRTGQQFRNQVVNNQRIDLPVSDLLSGLYFGDFAI